MNKGLLLLSGLMLSAISAAQSFGVVGETFPIAEQSFSTFIEQRLQTLEQTGALASLQDRWLKQAALNANRPQCLNLKRATEPHTHLYYPVIKLNQAIFDNDHHIIYSRGTRLNALKQLPTYRPCWLLLNSDDRAQLKWAKKTLAHCQTPKIILTGGAIDDTENALQRPIYFDQAGRISQKLTLRSVPALVTRQGDALLIHEPVIKDNGNER